MITAPLRTLGLIALILFGAAGAASLVFQYLPGADKEPTKADSRVFEKKGSNVIELKSALEAESFGITTQPAQEVAWHPKLFVDGRVVPNPHATLEVRAPFAGIVGTDAAFRLGTFVEAQKPLTMFEARFSPLERLDLKAKSAEAEVKFRGAEDLLKIRKERIDRFGMAEGSISLGNRDEAAVQFSEARMQKDIALSQWTLWKQALESVGKKSIIVPINAPISGEIAEIGAQPGSNVEAGQLLVRLVDFRRILVRLDFPLSSAKPPPDVEVETPGSLHEKPMRWRALLRSRAPSVEIGLQKNSVLYEIVPGQRSTPDWRPGLYVTASLNDPDQMPLSAIAIPASALLLHQGRTLVYVELRPGRYKRYEVELLDRVGDTVYLAAQGVTAEDAVVSGGAQILLSEEFRSDGDD